MINHPKGLTLIEVAITLATIGIILAISLPIYGRLAPNITLNSSAREITADLRYAQQLAVTEQKNHAVVFDMVLDQYTVTNVASSTNIKTVDLDSRISFSEITGFTSSTVTFNVTGAATESGSVVLVNNQNTTTTVEVKPSGYVKIIE